MINEKNGNYGVLSYNLFFANSRMLQHDGQHKTVKNGVVNNG